MGETIGEVLGNAVGVALSPLPLVAVIMLLMAPGGRAKATGLVAGWLVGMVAVLAVFAVAGPLGPDDEPRLVPSLLKSAVGVLFLVLAQRQWSSRPTGVETPEPPGWMTKVQGASAFACVGFGVLLSALNPKNLGLTAAAGSTIGAAGLTGGEAVVVGAVVVVVGSLGMLASLGAAVLAPGRSGPALERLREWLVVHNNTVMLVLFVVMGAKLLGDGIRGLA